MIGRRPHRLDEMCWCGVRSGSPMDHGGSYSTPPQVVRFDLEASATDGRAAMRVLHRKARELVGPEVEYQIDDVKLHPDTTDECYTWWSNRGQARAKNVGWRIDYHLATPGLAGAARQASVFKDQWFSDHAPLTIDYDFSV